MDFNDEVRTRSGRFQKRVEKMAGTDFVEEATKTSFVLPFIQMLGYDIFDPSEVVPEFTADVGTKKHEKVDFAIMMDGVPVLLLEAKKTGADLGTEYVSQLLRYFNVTEARFGILTDGINYHFFSDLEQQNVMDPRPFFEFNMLDFNESQVRELRRFTKEQFDKDSIVDAAREMKYTAQIKRLLANELLQPSDQFVRFVTGQVYEGRATHGVRKMFKGLTHSAFNEFISDKIRDRLNSALKQEDENADAAPEVEELPKWVSISEYNLPDGSRAPASIKFWDDEVKPVVAWYEVLTNTVDKLYREGILTYEDTPIILPPYNAIVVNSEPGNSDGSKWRRFREVRGFAATLFVYTNLSAADSRKRATFILSKFGKDPAKVYLEV